MARPTVTPEQREAWIVAKAALDEITAEREKLTQPARLAYERACTTLLAPTQQRFDDATRAFDRINGDLPEPIEECGSCAEPIFDGDPRHDTDDGPSFCAACAPTFGDMLRHPEMFGTPNDDGDYETMTAEQARAAVDAHLAAGGSLEDKVAF